MSKKTILFFAVVSVTIFSLALIFMAYAGAPSGSNGASGTLGLGYEPGELLVRFAPKLDGTKRTLAECNEILTAINGGIIKHSYKLVPGLTLVKLPTNVTVEKVLVVFKNNTGILYAHPNYICMVASTFPNDPRFEDLWGMHNTGQTACEASGTTDADIDAPEAWDIETDASDIIVAVIDSGVNYNHVDLAANMWINPGEDHPPLGVGPEDFDGVNDDENYDGEGNPLIDDLYGYDFCTRGQVQDSDPMDEHGHGTHCAGTLGAVGDNGEGVVGVCWNVKIMALRFIDNAGYGNAADAIKCIEYAIEMGAKVMSNSWAFTNDPYSLRDAVEAAGENGQLFVAAVHNYDKNIDQYPFYPASYDLDNIISVMATDQHDQREDLGWDPPPYPFEAWRSNYGAVSADLAAPGKYILSCWLENDYVCGHGTSMSTPHVAGACALVWAVNPSLSHLEVKGIILSTVDELEALNGLCVTEGRLNLNNAVLRAVEFPTDDELVGWWKFDEGSGDIAYDSAGDNDGTLTNMDPETDWVTGKIDGALDFDGDNDYVSLSPIVALLTDNVTISAWIRLRDNVSTAYPIVTQVKQDGSGYVLDLCEDSGNKPEFYLSNSSAMSPDGINVDVWYHLAGTYDGSDLKIFVDGELKDTNPTSGLTGCFHNAYIGYGYALQGYYFSGKIDDVRVYNYALSKFEIWDAMSGDAPRFRVKDSSDETVAWFDSFGNLFLKGSKQEDWKEPDGQVDEFIIEKNSGPTVYIDDSGNLFLQGGFTQGSTPGATGADEFRIQDSEGNDVAIIKAAEGSVHIKGKLCENPD